MVPLHHSEATTRAAVRAAVRAVAAKEQPTREMASSWSAVTAALGALLYLLACVL